MFSNGNSFGLGNGASIMLGDPADRRIGTLPWIFRAQLPMGPRE